MRQPVPVRSRRYISQEDAADYLGVSVKTIRRWIDTGRLVGYRVGPRYIRVDVQLDNGAVASQDLTDTFLNAPVRTIAGQQDVAMQLLDQSPVAFDEIVFADLAADYARKLDLQVLSGTGTSGQLAGILPIAGTNTVTYTDASPAGYKLVDPIGQAQSLIATRRLLAPDSIVMNSRRWFWLAASLDANNRPLVTPGDGNGQNTIAVYDSHGVEGVVGAMGNVPIVADPNMPTTLGAGTNQDEILVGRFQDAYLWEGELRTRALQEVLSGTLQVRLQLWTYCAFMPGRYAAAFTTITGTGLAGPAGYGP